MLENNPGIGIIGGGNMGEAFAGAMIQSGIFKPSSITICDILHERLNHLKATYQIHVAHDNFKVFNSSQIIILAVKPQQMEEVLTSIAQHPDYFVQQRKLIISVAAGFTLKKIENLLYARIDEHLQKELPIIRVMPNTPALVLQGMSGMSPNPYASAEEIKITRKILQAMGHVIEFEEKYLDAVTALSGSGPAYVFYLIESMIAAGIQMGLNPEDAKIMTLTTAKGAVALMESQNETAETLRKKVTSPGGTTQAALKVLKENAFKQNIIEAIITAAKRAMNLVNNMFVETISYPASFLAAFSFLSPCILPLIPAYFTFITGFSIEELTGNDGNQVRKKVILSTTAYVAGFSTVFILLGASASFLGGFIQSYSNTIRIAGGILIILLGFHLTGIIHFSILDVEKRIHLRKKPFHFLGTFMVGMAFAAGWSPCIGPQLGSILIIAGSKDTVKEGIFLLSLYSAGLAIPFMIISVFIHLVLDFIKKTQQILKYVNAVAGIFLILVGLILITDNLYILNLIG